MSPRYIVCGLSIRLKSRSIQGCCTFPIVACRRNGIFCTEESHLEPDASQPKAPHLRLTFFQSMFAPLIWPVSEISLNRSLFFMQTHISCLMYFPYKLQGIILAVNPQKDHGHSRLCGSEPFDRHKYFLAFIHSHVLPIRSLPDFLWPD